MKSLLLSISGLALGAATSHSAIIVNLDPLDGSNMVDTLVPINQTVVAPSNNGAGVTMNVTFTPSAVDIGQTTNAVNLMEIGGNANGTGLYLLGGELHFLGKMQGNATNIVSGFDDLDYGSGNNLVGIKSDFGLLTAGTEYSVAVIYDPLGANPNLTIGVLPAGGPLFQEVESLIGVGTKNNWSGNDTITVFNSPSNAGAGNVVAGNPFQEGVPMNALDGTPGRALMWNSQATLVPEPTGGLLIGVSAIALLGRRRRS